MRRGKVDKDSRKKTGGVGDDFAADAIGMSAAASNNNFDKSGGGAGGFKGLVSPMSGAGGRDISKYGSGKQVPATPLGMKGRAAQSRRQSVDAVLDQFRNGNRDSEQAYELIKKLENEDISSIVDALDQLSDILCQATYFTKAYEILSIAVKDI